MYLIRASARLLGLIAASTVFFQFYIALPAGLINVNLADPFAILALLTLGVLTLSSKEMPTWRIAEFNWMLILFGVLLLFAYFVGWTKIGNTQWAFGARLLGWVVLLGYLSAGYLVVTYFGSGGIRHMLEILALTATLVIVWQVASRLLYSYGFKVPHPALNFEGFSENRNAFAFQLLSVLALSIAYSKAYVRESSEGENGIFNIWRSWVPLGFLFAGIVWTASRAALLTAAVMLLCAYYKKIPHRKSLLLGIIFFALLWCAVWMLQYFPLVLTSASAFLNDSLHKIASLLNVIGGSVGQSESQSALAHSAHSPALPSVISNVDNSVHVVQSPISGEESNQERKALLLYGIELWRRSPLIGEGLGVFMANSAKTFGHPTVIHSTAVWILAEFGLIGVAIMGWLFSKLWCYSIRSGSQSEEAPRFALLLLLIAFVVFSQFHEVLFQRIIWLIGGVLIGAPLVAQHQKHDKGRR